MEPKEAAAIQAFVKAMAMLDDEYVQLLQRMGCKRITLHRF